MHDLRKVGMKAVEDVGRQRWAIRVASVVWFEARRKGLEGQRTRKGSRSDVGEEW